jgi:hypothetical protein
MLEAQSTNIDDAAQGDGVECDLSKLSQAKRLAMVMERIDRGIAASAQWYREAAEDFGFYDGSAQWKEEDKRALEAKGRPALVFNQCKPSIDLVLGVNANNPTKPAAEPVEPGDAFLCEVMNDLDFYGDQAFDYEGEEVRAFESALVCGRGFVGIDFRPNPDHISDISIVEANIPPHDVVIDPSARRGVDDAEWVAIVQWITVSQFKERYPAYAKDVEVLVRHSVSGAEAGNMFDGQIDRDGYIVVDSMNPYKNELDGRWVNRQEDLVRVVHMEYWEMFQRHYVWNPMASAWEEVDEGALKGLEEAMVSEGLPWHYRAVADRKVMWHQHVGPFVLYDGESPIPFKGFSIVPVFAYSDVSGRSQNHYGIIRQIKDPQREINKRWSQLVNLITNQVQPGVMVEEGAVPNINEFNKQMRTPGVAAVLNKGGKNGVHERTVPRFPDAIMNLEVHAQEMIKRITGINPDLLGMDSGRGEPGIVVRLRQQQGMTILQRLFNPYNRARRELFMRRLAIMSKHMSDEQVARVLGTTREYSIQGGVIVSKRNPNMVADIRKARDLRYNVVVKDVPGSLTKMAMELSVMLEMLQAGFPVPPEVLIEHLDISETLRQRWLEYISQQEQARAQQEQQAMQAQMQLEAEKIGVERERVQTEGEVKRAKLVAAARKDRAKMDLEHRRLGLEAAKFGASTEEKKKKATMDLLTFLSNRGQRVGQSQDNASG